MFKTAEFKTFKKIIRMLEGLKELHPGYNFEMAFIVGPMTTIRVIVYQRGTNSYYTNEYTLLELRGMKDQAIPVIHSRAVMSVESLEQGRSLQSVH